MSDALLYNNINIHLKFCSFDVIFMLYCIQQPISLNNEEVVVDFGVLANMQLTNTDSDDTVKVSVNLLLIDDGSASEGDVITVDGFLYHGSSIATFATTLTVIGHSVNDTQVCLLIKEKLNFKERSTM